MKKFIISLIILLFIFPSNRLASTDELLTSSALLTSLAPVITEEVYQYYGYEKQYDLYSAEIQKLKRNKANGYHFFITLKVTTYEEGHLPPYGEDKIVLDISPAGTQLMAYKHKADVAEKKANQFYRMVAKDIERSFKKKWRLYEQTRFNQYQYLANKEWNDNRLLLVSQLVKKMNKSDPSHFKNTIQPLVYFNEKEIIILYKDSEGMNEMISLRKSGDAWVVSECKQNQGKKMVKEIFSHL